MVLDFLAFYWTPIIWRFVYLMITEMVQSMVQDWLKQKSATKREIKLASSASLPDSVIQTDAMASGFSGNGRSLWIL